VRNSFFRLFPGLPVNRILLTSFATWKPHQRSNSSDDLLLHLLQDAAFASRLHVFRQLPVNVPVAQGITIRKLQQLSPQILVCCGMAEHRTHLTVEAQATVAQQTRVTALDLDSLIAGLPMTQISDNAGQFVCNALYYAMLNYLNQHCPTVPCLFIHVPVLTPQNQAAIAADFRSLIERLLSWTA